MSGTATESNMSNEYGFKNPVGSTIMDKVSTALWVLRNFAILLDIGFFILLFWNPYWFYCTALMNSIGTIAFRLYQRLPQASFTGQFLFVLLMEDGFHYLLCCAIYFFEADSLVLQLIFFFSLLHTASYSLLLLDETTDSSPVSGTPMA